eukprot:3008179-Rhodomonas_salina.1
METFWDRRTQCQGRASHNQPIGCQHAVRYVSTGHRKPHEKAEEHEVFASGMTSGAPPPSPKLSIPSTVGVSMYSNSSA